MNAQRGFSLVELMVAVAIGGIVMSAIAFAQNMVTTEIKGNQQKIASINFTRELLMTLDKPGVCDCNFAGLEVAQDGGVFSAEFPASRGLISACAVPPAAPPALATAGQSVPDGWGLKVKAVSIANMLPLDGNLSSARQYLGSVKVEYEAAPGTRALAPSISQRSFNVLNGSIQGCGKAPQDLMLKIADVPTNNDPGERAPSEVTCPADTKILGGGWMNAAGPLRVGCLSPFFAEVLSNRVVRDDSWSVVVRCHAVRAVAVCWRPSDPGAI